VCWAPLESHDFSTPAASFVRCSTDIRGVLVAGVWEQQNFSVSARHYRASLRIFAARASCVAALQLGFLGTGS
jgi:hypothetical protein